MTDALGARNIDAESHRPKLSSTVSVDNPSPPITTINDEDVPDINRAQNVSQPPPPQLSFLIETVRPNVFVNEIRLNAISTFVPSSRALFKSVEELLSRFSRMKGFAQSYLDICTPPAIKLAVGITFYYRVMKVMSQQGLTNEDMENCISKIESAFPETQFKIPSPLIPFFQAICAFKPSDERFGTVTPAIPLSPGATAANHGALSGYLMGILPNMTSLFNQAAHVSQTLPAIPINVLRYTDDVDILAPIVAVPANHSLDNNLNGWKNVDVGSQPIPFSPFTNPTERVAIQRSTGGVNVYPQPFRDQNNRQDCDVNSWLNYLKLSNRIDWIGAALEALDVFCIPFDKNLSLSELPCINGAYNAITYHYCGANYADANIARDAATPRLSLQCRGQVHEPLADSNTGRRLNGGLTRPEIEISALTQLNVSLPTNYYPDSNQVGAINNSRHGPYFEDDHLKQYAHIREFNAEDLLRRVVQDSLATARLDKRS